MSLKLLAVFMLNLPNGRLWTSKVKAEPNGLKPIRATYALYQVPKSTAEQACDARADAKSFDPEPQVLTTPMPGHASQV